MQINDDALPCGFVCYKDNDGALATSWIDVDFACTHEHLSGQSL